VNDIHGRKMLHAACNSTHNLKYQPRLHFLRSYIQK
jgi:hypothetical protein